MQQGNGGNQLWNMQAQLQESYPGTNNGTPNSVTNSHHGSVTSTGTNTGLGMGMSIMNGYSTPDMSSQMQDTNNQVRQQQIFQQLQMQKQSQQQKQQQQQLHQVHATSQIPQQQQQQQQQQKPVPQMNLQNTEKFLDLVEHYMKKINRPFERYPVVNGVRINLFVYYYMVSYVGGFVKAYQEQKFPLIAKQLGIPANNQPVFNEFLQCYYVNLRPFEQYAKTSESLNDPQRRVMLQQQQQQQQQFQAQAQPRPQIPQKTQVPQNTGRPPIPGQVPQAPQIKNTSSHQEQLHQHQIHLQQKFQEAQHKTLLQQQQLLQKKATKNSPTQYSQASTPHDVPQSPHVPINKANKITKPPLKTAKSRVSSINEEKIVTVFAKGNRKPDVIKNYTPYTTTHDRPGGLDILNIERVGEQLDDMKPVFLYFPELGKVDIKALSLGLLSGISAEINVALNVLLIISSDPNTHIPFEHCKILLDSLSLLGKKVIGKLWNFKYKSHLSESTKKLGKNMDYVKPKSRIDKIFEKYSRQFGDEDYTIEVNAFTSQEISSTKPDPPHLHPNRYDDKMNDKMNDNSSPPTSLNQSIINVESVKGFKIPSYLSMLHKCRKQADSISMNIYQKSYFDQEVVLVEELSTISLIFRNFSFVSNNNLYLARNPKYMEFLYTVIFATITKPEIFKFERKRLSLMKDALIVLSNIIHAIDIESELEVWLVFSLAYSFSSESSELRKPTNMTTSKYIPSVHRYHPHSVDIMSKLLCTSYANREKVANLLTGKVRDEHIIKMVGLNFGDDYLETGSLFKAVFSLFVSILPTDQMYQGVEIFNEMYQTCLQSLLGCLVLTEFLDEAPGFKRNIALDFLLSEERFGPILQHLSFVYTAVNLNLRAQASEENSLISAYAAELANSLTECAIQHAVANENVNEDLQKLRNIPRLFGALENQCGILVSPSAACNVTEQIIKTLKIKHKLETLLK
ncbi:hypothetical protein CAS74_002351 [Pichia kudriavzevii]|uniref:ARID domain-containing protein n=1 Tax=Pichia kudriavzevii TaxID=4909 RepID=A0A1Z8JPX6_PICKU|nr:hypothetical protein CAS74_002351 [Pichia kudriavzevii]